MVYQETTNIQLENYNTEHVPTESANGEVLLYIKKAINYKLRPDLMIYRKGKWSQFLLNNPKELQKHCSRMHIYRHPCMRQSEFNDEYIKPLSEKINQ